MLLGGMVTNAFVAAPLRADRMSSVSLRMSAGGEPMLSRRSAAAGAAAAAAVLFAQVLPAQAECSKFSPLCGSLPDVVALTAPGSDSDSVPAAFRSIKGSPFDNEARADAESNSVQALLCQLAGQSVSRSVGQSVGQSVSATLLAGSTWPTLTLYSGLLSSVLRVSLHLPMQRYLLLSSGRWSYFRMVFYSFHFLPIFLLAQIL